MHTHGQQRSVLCCWCDFRHFYEGLHIFFTVKPSKPRWIQADLLLPNMMKLYTLNSHLGLCLILKIHISDLTVTLCPAQRHFGFTYWKKKKVLRFKLTVSWFTMLTVCFHILFSLTEWNRISPGAVLFESWQLVDVTFSSYFKSSFHSKVKILLLAVTFRYDWVCHTVKKWKNHLRLRCFNCQRSWVFSGLTDTLTVCVSL